MNFKKFTLLPYRKEQFNDGYRYIKSLLGVHPEYTEYIPLHYYHHYIYRLKSIENHTPECKTQIITCNHSLPSSELKTTDDNLSSLLSYSLYMCNTLLFSPSLLFENHNFIAGLFIKSSYVLKMYDDFYNFMFNDSLAYKAFNDVNFEEDPSQFKKFQKYLAHEFLNKYSNNINKHVRFFVDRKKMNDIEEMYTECKTWRRYLESKCSTIIEDNVKYFNHIGFVTYEVPIYQDIDGPEKEVIELANEHL